MNNKDSFLPTKIIIGAFGLVLLLMVVRSGIELKNKYYPNNFGAEIIEKTELLEKRTYTSKSFDNGDGTTDTRLYSNNMHYKDAEGNWDDIDLTLEDMDWYWKMERASYKIFIAKDFGADRLIKFQNKYEGANHEIVYEPKMLAWVNKTDLSDFQVFRNQQSVQGLVSGNVVRYENAFGDGIHFEITLQNKGFKKEIVIDAKNKLELPPTVDHKLVALFKYTGTGLKIKSSDDLREWNSLDYFEEENGFVIHEELNSIYQSFIKRAYIIDEGVGTQQSIKVFWKRHNSSLYQAKVLPTQFLKDATYPVRADTVTEIQGNSNDAQIQVDNTSTTWSVVRAISTGEYIYSNTTANSFNFNRSDGRIIFMRVFMTFDTSPIGTDDISAATLTMYAQTAYDGDNDEYGYSTIAKSTPVSQTLYALADYSSGGSTDFSTTHHDNAATGWFDFDFNASGISDINKTGLTSLQVIEGHDFTGNETVVNGAYSGSTWRMDGNTDFEPYLTITHGDAPVAGALIDGFQMTIIE